MDLLGRVAGCCRSTLLLSLHARHIHDVVQDLFLLVTGRSPVLAALGLSRWVMML